MRKFRPSFDILSSSQQALWESLRPAPALRFVLYGGTAVALRLGHRQSADFDFFTEGQSDKKQLRSAFEFMQRATVLQEETNALTIMVPGATDQAGVKISFCGDIGFGRFAHPDTAAQMFGAAFQLAESLKAPCYFGDGDLSTLPATAREALALAASAIGPLPRVKKLSVSLVGPLQA